MQLVNLTPHPINLQLANNQMQCIQPSGKVARCSQISNLTSEINGVPVYTLAYGQTDELPEQTTDVYYIVSTIVAQSQKGKRSDLLVPYDYVRDAEGKIVACRGLGVL